MSREISGVAVVRFGGTGFYSKGVTSVTCGAWRVRHAKGMTQLDARTSHDLKDDEISHRILMEDDPVMRVVLGSVCAGQSLPEPRATGLVTGYSGREYVLFYESDECWDMVPGRLFGPPAAPPADAFKDALKKGGGRRPMLPDSFSILAVGNWGGIS